MDRKIRVAVLGTGQIAKKARIPALLSNKHVEPVALVDTEIRKAEKVAKKLGIKGFYASIDDLFARETVDAVIICTPPNTHAELAVKAMNYGAHVFCEKPIATTLEDGKRVFQTSLSNKRILMISSQRRFIANYRRAKQLITKGTAGHVYCISDTALSLSPLFAWGKSPWYYQPEGGGVLLDLGPYCFDTLNYFFECFPNSIFARNHAYLDSPVEDCSYCIIEYPDNRTGIAVMSWLASATVAITSIHGTAETIHVSADYLLEINPWEIPQISQFREDVIRLLGMKFPNLPFSNIQSTVNVLQVEINSFVKQIRNGKTYSKSALNALNVLATIEAAKKSSSLGKQVKIETFNY